MPSFGDINTVYTPVRKLTLPEILRAIQFAIASEYETIQIYQQITESADNAMVKTVMSDLINDEMHHAGALLKLMYILSPQDAAQYEIGAQKVLSELGISGRLNITGTDTTPQITTD